MALINLSNNENPYGTSMNVLNAIQQITSCMIARYPEENSTSLKYSLATKLNVNPNQVIIGNGSSEILELIIKVLSDLSGEVIIPEHSFFLYTLIAKIAGVKLTTVPNIQWQCNLEQILKQITMQTKLIIIANPNNPTGSYIDFIKLVDFILSIPKHVVVVIDEAYFEYVMVSDYGSMLPLINLYKNLIIVRSFSKIYGLAGVRVGYAIGDSSIIQYIQQLRQPYSVSSIATVATIAALKDDKYIEFTKQNNQKGLSRLTKYFADSKWEYISSVANFIMVNFRDEAVAIYQWLLKHNIKVCILKKQYNLGGYLRITVGLDHEIDALIHTLNEFNK